MTSLRKSKKRLDPGHNARQILKRMDSWANRMYLTAPLLLVLFGGRKLARLVIVIYPVISATFLIIRYRYLRKLTSDEQKHVFPHSYIYTGAALSFIILLITAVSGLMLLFDFINSKF
ncbi:MULTISPECIES: hypothetical protein [Pseudomonas syringae group]|nr:hypothetical protein [Pseudomonas viridiflava]MBD8572387.1 hypothetical protein [Pseudomonas syringae]MEE4127495.1 hypothetical protein [Pseudomonas viridiflava]